MVNDEKQGKLTQVLFTTFLTLNIVLTSVHLYTIYQKNNGGTKKCSCKQKELS